MRKKVAGLVEEIDTQLVILDAHVPLEVTLAETAVRQPDTEALTSFMRKLEFTTLLRRVAEGLGAELPAGMTPSPPPQRPEDR